MLLAMSSTSSTHAAEGVEKPALAPLAFVRFCMEYPEDCRAAGDRTAKPLDWSPDLIRRLSAVNAAVNAQIKPRPRPAGPGIERWLVAPARGDCNDYAVTKRHRLLAEGLPPSALLLAVVTAPSNEGHLVLLVRTTRRDMVLDNLDGAIRPLPDTRHRLISRQTATDPRRWASLTR